MPAHVNWTAISTIIAGLNFLGLAGLGLYTWVSNKSKVNQNAIQELTKVVTKNAARLDVVENNHQHMPTQTDIGQLYGELRKANEKIAGMNGRLGTLAPILQLISEHLISSGRKA